MMIPPASDETIKDTDADPLWTVGEAADYLRLTPDTIRAMARGGKLPAVKVGRSWRFPKSKLIQFVQAQQNWPLTIP